jgi:hypothetical protein
VDRTTARKGPAWCWPCHHITMRNSHANSRYHEPLIGVMRQKPTATKLVSLAMLAFSY